jgi:hypothetical protein
MGDIAFVVLHPLLVAPELMLDLMNALIHRSFRRRSRLARDKIMFVFGRDQDFYLPAVLAMIDCDFDRHQAPEVLEKLFGLIMHVALLIGFQSTVPGRNLNLHPRAPWQVVSSSSSFTDKGDY